MRRESAADARLGRGRLRAPGGCRSCRARLEEAPRGRGRGATGALPFLRGAAAAGGGAPRRHRRTTPTTRPRPSSSGSCAGRGLRRAARASPRAAASGLIRPAPPLLAQRAARPSRARRGLRWRTDASNRVAGAGPQPHPPRAAAPASSGTIAPGARRNLVALGRAGAARREAAPARSRAAAEPPWRAGRRARPAACQGIGCGIMIRPSPRASSATCCAGSASSSAAREPGRRFSLLPTPRVGGSSIFPAGCRIRLEFDERADRARPGRCRPTQPLEISIPAPRRRPAGQRRGSGRRRYRADCGWRTAAPPAGADAGGAWRVALDLAALALPAAAARLDARATGCGRPGARKTAQEALPRAPRGRARERARLPVLVDAGGHGALGGGGRRRPSSPAPRSGGGRPDPDSLACLTQRRSWPGPGGASLRRIVYEPEEIRERVRRDGRGDRLATIPQGEDLLVLGPAEGLLHLRERHRARDRAAASRGLPGGFQLRQRDQQPRARSDCSTTRRPSSGTATCSWWRTSWTAGRRSTGSSRSCGSARPKSLEMVRAAPQARRDEPGAGAALGRLRRPERVPHRLRAGPFGGLPKPALHRQSLRAGSPRFRAVAGAAGRRFSAKEVNMADREPNRSKQPQSRWGRFSKIASLWVLLFLVPLVLIQLMDSREEGASPRLLAVQPGARARQRGAGGLHRGAQRSRASSARPSRASRGPVTTFRTELPVRDSETLVERLEEAGRDDRGAGGRPRLVGRRLRLPPLGPASSASGSSSPARCSRAGRRRSSSGSRRRSSSRATPRR